MAPCSGPSVGGPLVSRIYQLHVFVKFSVPSIARSKAAERVATAFPNWPRCSWVL